jgi:hypothetical protein
MICKAYQIAHVAKCIVREATDEIYALDKE